MQLIKYCNDVLQSNVKPPLKILFVILCGVWRSVENQCVTRFRGNGLLMRVMRAGLGDTSTIGISIPAKNIITFSIRISLLCWAQGGTFSEKIFFDLDWITRERCDDWDDCNDDYSKVNVCPLQKNGVLLTILPTFMFLCHSHDSHTFRKSFLFEFKQAAFSIMV